MNENYNCIIKVNKYLQIAPHAAVS